MIGEIVLSRIEIRRKSFDEQFGDVNAVSELREGRPKKSFRVNLKRF